MILIFITNVPQYEGLTHTVEDARALGIKRRNSRGFRAGIKSVTIAADTSGVQAIFERHPTLVITRSLGETFGVKIYDEDGNHTGYTPRGDMYADYKEIWDAIPDIVKKDDQGNVISTTRPPLLPHVIAGHGTKELNMEVTDG